MRRVLAHHEIRDEIQEVAMIRLLHQFQALYREWNEGAGAGGGFSSEGGEVLRRVCCREGVVREWGWSLSEESLALFEEVVKYETLTELQEAWRKLDESVEPNVLLVLGENFRGHLPSLIQRRGLGGKLVLSAPGGYLPGWTSAGDLALSARRLGWWEIRVYRDVREGVAEVLRDGGGGVAYFPGVG